MFNISVVLIGIKQGSAVLFERFLANLWSNQSSFWLRRCQVYNNLFGVFLIGRKMESKSPHLPIDPQFIRPSTRSPASGRKHLFKNNNHCLSIATTRRYRLIKVISILKNTGRRWTTSTHRRYTLKTPVSCRRGFANAKLLRPKM